jgi:GT2 family glycosyltransferase
MPNDRQSPSVSVVIVNYNGEHYLPGMMAALKATGYPFLEILVADDASTDRSLLYLRHHHPEVVILASDVNAGPAVARNRGLSAARGEWILYLDNDGHPEPTAVHQLVSALAAHPEAVAAMPRIILAGPPRLVHCDGAATHFTGQMWLRNSHVEPQVATNQSGPISSLMGTGMLVRRDAARAIHGFAEEYFIYYEDHEFGTALFLAGGDLICVPEAVILHLDGTQNLSFRIGRDYPSRRAYLTAKNRIRFTLVALEGRTLAVLLPLLLLHEFAQASFSIAKGWAETYTAGLFWNISHLGRSLRAREAFQTRRQRPDTEMLVDGPMPIHPGLLKGRGALTRAVQGLERVLLGLYRLSRPFLNSGKPLSAKIQRGR